MKCRLKCIQQKQKQKMQQILCQLYTLLHTRYMCYYSTKLDYIIPEQNNHKRIAACPIVMKFGWVVSVLVVTVSVYMKMKNLNFNIYSLQVTTKRL